MKCEVELRVEEAVVEQNNRASMKQNPNFRSIHGEIAFRVNFD